MSNREQHKPKPGELLYQGGICRELLALQAKIWFSYATLYPFRWLRACLFFAGCLSLVLVGTLLLLCIPAAVYHSLDNVQYLFMPVLMTLAFFFFMMMLGSMSIRYDTAKIGQEDCLNIVPRLASARELALFREIARSDEYWTTIRLNYLWFFMMFSPAWHERQAKRTEKAKGSFMKLWKILLGAHRPKKGNGQAEPFRGLSTEEMLRKQEVTILQKNSRSYQQPDEKNKVVPGL